MSAQLLLKKWVVPFLALGLLGWPGLLGCQSASPRVYKVAYSFGRSDQRTPMQEGFESPHNYSDSTQNFLPNDYSAPGLDGFASMPPGQPQESATLYHIGVGDILSIKVFQLLEVNREESLRVEVDPAGNVYLPVLEHVSTAGLTCTQLRDELVLRLGREFIRDPKVDVTIIQHHSKEVMVLGAVRRPGPVALRTDCAPLLDVISYAGGVGHNTAPDIEILRGVYKSNKSKNIGAWAQADQGQVQRDSVSISELFGPNGARVNLMIYPGDVVKIPSGSEGYVYLSGEVKQPGAKSFRRPLNILQAITCAGGTTDVAADKKCKIVRRLPSGVERVVVVDLKKIRSGEQENLLLAQNDIVMVPVDPVRKFFEDINDMIKRGVNVGMDVTYDAGGEMGIPSTTGSGI